MQSNPKTGKPSPTRFHALGTVVAAFTGAFFSVKPLLFATFGIFLVPITEEFGWPRTYVAMGLLIISICGALIYPFSGRLADRFGVRPVVLVGMLVFGGSVALLSLTPDIPWVYFAIYTLIGILATLPSGVMYTKAVVGWFAERRGLMLGIVGGGGYGLGSTFVPVIAAILVASIGWRGAYAGLAVIVVLFALPIMVWLFREPPHGISLEQDETAGLEGMPFAEARRTSDFWIIAITIGLGAGAGTAIFSHVVPLMTDRGFDLSLATSVMVAYSLTCTVWQVILGLILDRTGEPRIAVPLFLAAVPAILLMMFAESPLLLIIGGMLAGVSLGTEYGLLPYWVPRYFGRRHYGAIYGFLYGSITLVMGITPVIMDIVFDTRGSYDLALYGVIAALVLSSLLIFGLRRYSFDVQGQPVNEGPVELADPAFAESETPA